ncbi:RNA polymerase sigma-70 factor [Mariniphaga sediminis]|jgi:RNA polymerase sigma-70 factor (ECF subfamily)|uniref:RNA polymerase sigma factor n=1 Tax=Mariniphaga sediminis TaxID=1628158 RepID=A0A399CWN3_9BACT|nr:RNA polymerase sigma-70 factor [Mariniphaga sediminis]RIH62821.1 RNA polymerase sigma-70 factor [Mariniphaga sediminis]
MSNSNTELVKLLKKGDMTAFDVIYKKYSRRLYGFVFRYVKQDTDTEEIVQEVFLKIWKSRDNINIYSSFESFLFTIAHNATVNLLKRKATEQKYIEHIKSLQYVDETYELTDEIHYKELKHKFQNLLNELSPRQKEIFHLSREEGLNHKEIAEKLGISTNTVKNHLVTTLSFLKGKIDNGLLISQLFVCLFL